MNKDISKRSRNFNLLLYPDTHAELISKLDTFPCSYILHDKDLKEDGTPKEAHYHVVLHYDNARSMASISRKLNLDIRFIEFTEDYKYSIRYLVHADHPNKTPYTLDELHSNQRIDHLFADKASEDLKVSVLLDIVFNNPDISFRTLASKCLSEGIWDAYRRNYSIVKDILIEAREERSTQS